MGKRAGWRVCTIPGCPEFTQAVKCDEHRAEAEQRRGTARERGYGQQHERRFRPGVLAKDPTCVLCRQAPSVHADHYPLSRRQLVAADLDPDDPAHGRGLCGPCHSRHTAAEQPGGWNQ